MDEKELLSTGELVKILGTTKNTLFHYDNLGLFCPAVVRENGYRAYSYRQIDLFLAITSLRESGMSLHDIKAYMEQRNPARLQEILREQQKDIQREIHKLRQMDRFLGNHLRNLDEVKAIDTSYLAVEEQREELLLCSPSTTGFDNKDGLMLLGHFFAETLYLRSFGSILSMDTVRAKNYLHYECFFRFADKKEKGKPYCVKPRGRYLVGYHKGGYYTTGQAYVRILTFAEKEGLSLGPEVYEEYLIDELAALEEQDYITRISIPVLEK